MVKNTEDSISLYFVEECILYYVYSISDDLEWLTGSYAYCRPLKFF